MHVNGYFYYMFTTFSLVSTSPILHCEIYGPNRIYGGKMLVDCLALTFFKHQVQDFTRPPMICRMISLWQLESPKSAHVGQGALKAWLAYLVVTFMASRMEIRPSSTCRGTTVAPTVGWRLGRESWKPWWMYLAFDGMLRWLYESSWDIASSWQR